MNGLSVPLTRRQRQEVFWSWIDERVNQLVRDLAEKTLELQMQAYLQARWNQRTPARRGYRNGYYRRRLLTPHGSLSIRVPRARDGGPDGSLLFDRYQRRIADVDRILRHAFLLGASTRGTAELAEQIFGDALSHQTVSRLMRWLDEQLALWRRRAIPQVYPVVYVDGMHVNVLGADRMVMLVAGQRADGVVDLLGFCVSTGEQCLELLKDLRRRGLEGVEMFVSDDSGAIRSALEQVYPEVMWQHCTFHRLKALREGVGATAFRDRMLAEAACLFRCPSAAAALEAAVAWARRWRSQSPWAVQQFMTDLQDSLQFYRLPKRWWRRVRTNNPLERRIRMLRQRLQPMGCFHDEPAVERAVFGQALRWRWIPELTHNT